MAEIKKKLPPRASETDRIAKHHARRVASWTRGEKRKDARRKAQEKRERANREAVAELANPYTPLRTTREVIRNGRTVVRRVQPSKTLRALRRLNDPAVRERAARHNRAA